MTSLLTYFIIKLWVSYFNHFYKTKLERVNTKTNFLDNKTQRFRVFFYVFFSPLALVLLFLFVQFQISHAWFEPLYTSLLFIAFLYCMWFLNFTWSDKFHNNYTINKSLVTQKQFSTIFKFKDLSQSELESLNTKYNQHFDNYQDLTTYWYKNEFNQVKLNCIHKERNKLVSYKKIFELLDELVDKGILDLFDKERSKFFHYIILNFKRDGETIDIDNLNAAYCKWRKRNG
ncbi:hypothetical protein [Myroides odoratimimus]|uniref:hypothetical protein n=1 Tax=Myroides odoratimimus TaxID=76832 RepID=UPI0025782F6A|nr:hypothetical protein [Myroides odoratimimus]MDM1528888.1 hypothetical protein [Myroides odoratimimus]